MKWFLKALKQYTDFNGRARRTEYWMYILFYTIFSYAAFMLDYLLGTTSVFTGIYALALLLPTIAVGVRRLHDIGKSGWMMLVGLIPVIGGIWLLILFIKEGTPGSNEYGINPKEVSQAGF